MYLSLSIILVKCQVSVNTLKSSLRIIDLNPVSLVVSTYEGIAMVGRLLEDILTGPYPRQSNKRLHLIRWGFPLIHLFFLLMLLVLCYLAVGDY